MISGTWFMKRPPSLNKVREQPPKGQPKILPVVAILTTWLLQGARSIIGNRSVIKTATMTVIPAPFNPAIALTPMTCHMD